MLADKLLAKADYDCSREVRTLELLKLRFGDANLHNCEVCPGPAGPPPAVVVGVRGQGTRAGNASWDSLPHLCSSHPRKRTAGLCCCARLVCCLVLTWTPSYW